MAAGSRPMWGVPNVSPGRREKGSRRQPDDASTNVLVRQSIARYRTFECADGRDGQVGRRPRTIRGRSATSLERASIGARPATRAAAWASRSVCGPNSTRRGRSCSGALAHHAASRSPQPGSRADQSTRTTPTESAGGRSAGVSTRTAGRPAAAHASAIRVAMIRSRATIATVEPSVNGAEGRGRSRVRRSADRWGTSVRRHQRSSAAMASAGAGSRRSPGAARRRWCR